MKRRHALLCVALALAACRGADARGDEDAAPRFDDDAAPRFDDDAALRFDDDAALRFDDDTALRAGLLERMAVDQAVRVEAMELIGPGKPLPVELSERWQRIDAENTAWIEQVLDARGWPGKSAVGEDGLTAVFLLVQHADARPDLQRRALPLLAAAVEAGDAQPSELALLTDRVRLKDGLPQLYGSQVRMGDDGPVPFEIEDAEHVDERRAAMGLEPLADYLRRFR